MVSAGYYVSPSLPLPLRRHLMLNVLFLRIFSATGRLREPDQIASGMGCSQDYEQ